MTERRPDDELPIDGAIDRAYRRAANDAPPPALDAAILAAAHRAVNRPAPRRAFARWTVPVATAAVIVLSVGVALQLLPDAERESPVSAAAPAEFAPPPADAARQSPPPLAEAPVAARRKAPALNRTQDRAAAAAPATAAPASPEMRTQAAFAKQEAYASADQANVISVAVRDRPGAYEFDVGIKSADTGCQRYANWWEVVSEDGKLLYRRVLAHSHVDEQPFTRGGGPVPVAPETVVWVRAHMHPTGYGGQAFRGSVASGFVAAELPATFAAVLAKQPPLPAGCAF